MTDFGQLLEIIGSGTRLRLLELLSVRARSLNELASNLGVTQQAVMKHISMLERNGLVQQIKVSNKKSKVKNAYTLSKPLSMGYTFKNGILCLYIGSGEHDARPANKDILEMLRSIEYGRNLLRMRTKVLANRLRTMIEEDLKMQAEANSAIKKLKPSPIQAVALKCVSAIDSEKQLEQASKAFGMNLIDTIRHLKSQA